MGTRFTFICLYDSTLSLSQPHFLYSYECVFTLSFSLSLARSLALVSFSRFFFGVLRVFVVCLFVSRARASLHLLSIQLGKIKEVRYMYVWWAAELSGWMERYIYIIRFVSRLLCHSHYKAAYIFNYIVFTRSSYRTVSVALAHFNRIYMVRWVVSIVVSSPFSASLWPFTRPNHEPAREKKT